MNIDTKSSAVLLIAFVVLFVPSLVEIVLFPHGPFLMWRLVFEDIKLAKWQMICYIVFSWFFAFSCFYIAIRCLRPRAF